MDVHASKVGGASCDWRSRFNNKVVGPRGEESFDIDGIDDAEWCKFRLLSEPSAA